MRLNRKQFQEVSAPEFLAKLLAAADLVSDEVIEISEAAYAGLLPQPLPQPLPPPAETPRRGLPSGAEIEAMLDAQGWTPEKARQEAKGGCGCSSNPTIAPKSEADL